MELELHRIDLLQTNAAAPGTLQVLPPGENKTQKVAVGDLSGVVQCFSVKKGEVTLSFKTLPCQDKVTAMALGMGIRQKDKIFFAVGNTVRGMTKKGKEFFRFTTALTEAISHLRVAESHIWAGCQQIHNHFIEATDSGLYMSPDRIMATELIPLTGTSDWLPVIACRDCCIRIISKNNQPMFEVATASPPTAVRYVADVHGPATGMDKVKELLYGCQDGRLVQLLLNAQTVRQGFVISGGGSQEVRAAVTAIYCGADYSKTGCCDIIIGREDGSLEVWDVDSQGQPQLVVSTQLSESITSVGGGYITSAASPDIIVHTFTGKVIAYASHPGALQPATEQSFRRSSTVGRAGDQDLVATLNARMAKEAAELAELRVKVAKERERYAANQQALSMSQSVVDVRHRLALQDGCFVLFVEAAVSLFALALQSTLPLALLDLPSNVAILSETPADETVGNATLATYRCQESTNRLSIKFKAREGAAGKIFAYIIPAIPPKTCSVVEVQLPPLCMHQMVSSIQGGGSTGQPDTAQHKSLMQQLRESRPCSELVIQGSFSVHVFHSWLREVLPDVPAHLPANSTSGGYLFKESQLGTMVSCSYTDGEAMLVCDSVTTLAILHDCLLASATATKQRVNIRYQLHSSALQHCCSILWPFLEEQRALARQQKLAGALQELHTQESDTSFLASEYRDIVSQQGAGSNRQGVGKDLQGPAGDEGGLDAVVDMFKQLYKNYRRLLSGATLAVKQHLPGLEKLLRGHGQDSTLEAVLRFVHDTCR